MKNKEYKQNIPEALVDDVLDNVGGGITTTVPRTVEEAQLQRLIRQNPNLTVEELVALYAETYGTAINTGNPDTTIDETKKALSSIARSQ